MNRYQSVVLDVDSTLSGIEGIDWLAAKRGMDVAEEIADLTAQAMDGSVPLEALYGLRLDMVRPSRMEIAGLAKAYQERQAPGVTEALAALRAAGVTLHVLSGGLREALLPFAATLGFAPESVSAVGVHFDQFGKYAGWETRSPLAAANGKALVLKQLALPAPVLMVGDGVTDARTKEVGAAFAGFTGFVARERALRKADHKISAFDQLPPLVLS